MNNIRALNRELKLEIPILIILMVVLPLITVPTSFHLTIIIRYLFFTSLGVIALAYLLVLWRNGKLPLRDRTLLPLLVFFPFAFLSALFSQYPTESWIGAPARFTGFITYILFIVFFLLALYAGNKYDAEKIKKIIYVWLTATALISAVGLVQYLGANLIPFSKEVFAPTKSYSTLLNSNHFGTYLVMAIPFAAYFYLEKKTLYSKLIFALVYGSLLTTLSRGAWLGLLAGMIFFFFRYPRKERLLSLGIVIVIITFMLMPLNSWAMVTQADSFLSEAEMAMEGDLQAGSGRFLLWQESLQALPDSALIGTGPDTLFYAAPERFEATFGENYPAKAHNIFLEIAVTMGIPALLAYLAFLFLVVRGTNQHEPLLFAFKAMIIMYVVQGMFLVDVLSVYPIFWVLTGFYLGIKQNKKLIASA